MKVRYWLADKAVYGGLGLVVLVVAMIFVASR